MIAKMTSHLGQIALAALAALAFTFPSPRDARDAIDRVLGSGQTTLEASPGSAVVGTPGRPTIRIAHDPAAECLATVDADPVEALKLCADQLYFGIIQDNLDRAFGTSQKAAPVAFETEGYEPARLALSQLCRGLWSASNGDVQALEIDACRYAVSGVEQFVQMQ